MKPFLNLKRVILLCGIICLYLDVYPQRINNLKTDEYIPIDSNSGFLLQTWNTRLFYLQEWFANKKFHSSCLELPTNEIMERISRMVDCDYLMIDSLSIVFVPKQVGFRQNNNVSTGLITMGDPKKYGQSSNAILSGRILNGKSGKFKMMLA
jgi:hypothetical protein